MRVWLLSKDAVIETLSLPSEADEYYNLSDISSEVLPVSFETRNRQWFCRVKPGGILTAMDGDPVSDTAPECPIRDRGVVKILFREGLQERLYLLYAEAEEPKESSFSAYSMDAGCSYKIGSGTDCQIRYSHRWVSAEHALLRHTGNCWEIHDAGSAIGVYVNGKRVFSQRLHNGDSIFIMGLYILFGVGFIVMNGAEERLSFHSPGIQRMESVESRMYSSFSKALPYRGFFERQPRKPMRFCQDAIQIESPPMPLSASKIPFLLRMGSPMVMGGRALASGNVLMALTSLVLPGLTQGLTEKERKEYELKRQEGYRKYLNDKREEIQQEKLHEEQRLNEAYPSLTEAMRLALKKERLWERRRGDDDFLKIRIGAGQFPLMTKREYPPRQFELEPDPLEKEMYDLAERPFILKNVPIMLSLKTDYIIGVPGKAHTAPELVRNMILQLALTHSYDEVKIVLLARQKYGEILDFVRYLPHNWDNDRSIRFLVSSPSDALRIGEYLSHEIIEYREASNKRNAINQRPVYVAFALDKDLFDRVEALKGVTSSNEYSGVSVIAAFDGVPKDCKKLIELRGENRLKDYMNEVEDQRFSLDSFDAERAAVSVQELMRTKLMVGAEAYLLPNMVTFLEMFQVGMVENLKIRENWSRENPKNNPVSSLAAPVGIGTDGEIFMLDMHEKFHGPHGLVAGMTGSGKSEFLITYILSMSVLYRPDEVSFILIDYKGGGLTDAFADKRSGAFLPHLAGTITNLDGSSIQRCLVSIDSEIKRRESLFREAKAQWNEGKMEIYDYQRLYREGKLQKPLSHLFIIADEFAELRDQQPKFLDKLISVARVGRSLGVHLILATQKPGGVVNKQMWSNMKTHVCLRVQEREDSMEMLQRQEASELRHTGRFYLQVGNNDYFGMGQSAWCGSDYYPQKEVVAEKDESIHFLNDTGDEILPKKPETNRKKADFKQLVVIVKELWNVGKALGLRAKQLWEEPLAQEMEVRLEDDAASFRAKGQREEETLWVTAAKLLKSAETKLPPPDFQIPALIGRVDDPEGQQQFPFYLDMTRFYNLLLIGEAGSGKSTFLRTLLYSLLTRCSPDELCFYILDLSNGMLSDLKTMPHCGAYLTEKNESDLNRLFRLLHDIVEERKRLFQEEGVPGFREYRQRHAIPLILVIVDGFSNITALKDSSAIQSAFHDYLREGTNFGIRYLITANHLNELSARSKQELDYRIALQAKDRYVYGDILSCKCSFEPMQTPGRGLCVLDERTLEYQTALVDDWSTKLEDLKKEHKDDDVWKGRRVKKLTMPDTERTYAEFCAEFPKKERIPLGYYRKDMRAVAIPFKQLYHMSLYFGNPAGPQAIFRNLTEAAVMNDMNLLIVRRQTGSVFNATDEKLQSDRVTILNSTPNDLPTLRQRLLDEIAARNKYRDEYCVQQGIPGPYNGMAVRAAHYIRAHTTPLLVILERFYDLCLAANAAKETGTSYEHEFGNFFAKMRGYNVYFAAGFYPEDPKEGAEALTSQPMAEKFNLDQFLLLFGGRFDKYAGNGMDYNLATKYKKVVPEINRFTMKYNGEAYPMVMPCGKLETEDADPDDAPIL